MAHISTLIAALAAGTAFAAPIGASAGYQEQVTGKVLLAAATTALADGEVVRLDRASGTVVLKHGPIPSINMPPMTMGYRVKDKGMLDQLKPGDKIRFEAGNVGGAYTVMRFEKAK